MAATRRFSTALAVAGLVMLALSVGTALAASSVSITETNERYAYHPGTIYVPIGDTVTWTNNSDAPHTVDADDLSFESEQFNEGETYQNTFATAGTFKYHCDVHSYMHATVVVLAAGVTAPPTDTAPISATPATAGGDTTWFVLLAFGIGILGMAVWLRRRSRAA
jgi:plastocyanin